MPQGRAENILEDEDIGMIFIKRRYKFTQGKILMKVGQNYTKSMQFLQWLIFQAGVCLKKYFSKNIRNELVFKPL